MTCSYDVIEVKIAFPRTAVRFLRVFGLKNSVKLSTSGLVDLAVIELKFNQETLTSKAILYSKIEFLLKEHLCIYLSYRVIFRPNYPLTSYALRLAKKSSTVCQTIFLVIVSSCMLSSFKVHICHSYACIKT